MRHDRLLAHEFRRTVDVARSRHIIRLIRRRARPGENVVRTDVEEPDPARRGKGETQQLPEAELHMPDGSVRTKVKEVNEALEDILGLNREQFLQTAMISQGDFLKLLLASTEERQKIFRRIFHTERFAALQDRLKQRSADCERTCDRLAQKIESCVEQLRPEGEARVRYSRSRESLIV